MASLTKEALADRILEYIGIKPAGESARAEDAELVKEAIDACHDELSSSRLVPFATSAIPEWAQNPLRDYVAAEVAAAFGMQATKRVAQDEARAKLAESVSGLPKQPVRVRYY